MEHNLELMVCSLSRLIVAPAFKSVIPTMPHTIGQNCSPKCLKISRYINRNYIFNLFKNSCIMCVFYLFICYLFLLDRQFYIKDLLFFDESRYIHFIF